MQQTNYPFLASQKENITINPANYNKLIKIYSDIKEIDKNKLQLISKYNKKVGDIETYIDLIDNKNYEEVNKKIEDFFNFYNEIISLYIKFENLYIKLKDNEENIPSYWSLSKDKNTKIVLDSLNGNIKNIKKTLESIRAFFSVIFEKISFFISKEIEKNNDDYIYKIFELLGYFNDSEIDLLIEKYENKNDFLGAFHFIIDDNPEQLFKITNFIKDNKNAQNLLDGYLEANINNDINIDGFEDIKSFKELSKKQRKLLSVILKKNYKYIFNKILGNPQKTNQEKIEEIEKIFRDNIQENYLFTFRGRAGEIFEEIFKDNILAVNIFESLIYRDKKKKTINKNIRLVFIENHKDINKILEYITNPIDGEKSENISDEIIKIKLGTRSNIALLNRLENEIKKEKDTKKKEKFQKYFTYFQTTLTKRYFIKKDILKKDKNHYKINTIKGEIKLIEQYFKKNDINNIKEFSNKIQTELNQILENKKELTEDEIKEALEKNKIDTIKSSDLIQLIKKGTFAYILYDAFENGKIQKPKKSGWKKAIAYAIIENSKNFTINFLLKTKFFSNLEKQEIIFKFLKESDNTIRKLEILNIIPNNFNKKEILKILISGKNIGYSDFINILGNQYFKDLNISLYKDNGDINQEDIRIFLEIFAKSKNERFFIQGVGFMKDFADELVKGDFYIPDNTKNIQIMKSKQIIAKL